MRILYGVVGEGMGHAMRSRVILDHLTKDHEVQVVVSGRAHDYLVKRASERLSVRKIWGLNIVYEDNEVQNFRTVLANLKGAVTGMPKNVRAYFDIAEKFAPDVVISDFESWSYLFGKNHMLPVLSVDNIQMLTRCAHPPEILAGHENEFRIAKTVIKAEGARGRSTTSSRPSSTRRSASRGRRWHRRSCGRRSWPPSAARAITCSSTRRRRRTRRCPRSWRAPGASAASTVCAAI